MHQIFSLNNDIDYNFKGKGHYDINKIYDEAFNNVKKIVTSEIKNASSFRFRFDKTKSDLSKYFKVFDRFEILKFIKIFDDSNNNN